MSAVNNEAPPAFKERLRIIISELQLKQTEFAKSLGISANYVYLLTSGKKSIISEPLAKLIESTYGYRAGWILTGRGEKKAKDQSENLKADLIGRISQMTASDLEAVATFIQTCIKSK